MTRLGGALLAAVALSAAACAGPTAPLEVGSKDVPVDLLLGAKVKRVAQAPVPPVLMPTPTSFLLPASGGLPARPSATSSTVPFTPPPGPCPAADPLVPPKLGAPNRVPGPPKPAVFRYRTSGRLVSGGAMPTEVVLDAESTVEVEASAPDGLGNFTFDMTVENGKAQATTTTYRVIRTEAGTGLPSEAPEDVPRPSDSTAGIYLARVATQGNVKPFEPTFPGIQVVRLPLDLGASFSTAGTDGATTVSWRSTVKEKKNVDACGTPLDSYVVELTDGTITGGEDAERLTFSSTMNLGTQFGGLPLRIDTTTQGTAPPNVPVTRSVTMTINSPPDAP